MSAAIDRVQVLDTPEVLALKGRRLGPSRWLRVDQDRVDAFARAVDDWHWAHHDVERASRGPFGATIGHAHLTLSLIPHLFASLVEFAEGEDAMFYGYNRVRFPTAVPVGSNVRMSVEIEDVVGRRAADRGPAHRDPGDGPSSLCGPSTVSALPREGPGLIPPTQGRRDDP